MGEARERDSRGRPLPVWQGCRVVADGRSLPHELAVGGLSRRPLFRACSRHRPSSARRCLCGPGRSDRDRPCRENSVIPLFGRTQHHSSVPTKFATAVARSGGPGRPRGRRDQRFTLDGREHDGRLAASSGRRVLRGDCDDRAAIRRRWRDVESSVAGRAFDRARLASIPLQPSSAEASRRFAMPEHWIRAVMQR